MSFNGAFNVDADRGSVRIDRLLLEDRGEFRMDRTDVELGITSTHGMTRTGNYPPARPVDVRERFKVPALILRR